MASALCFLALLFVGALAAPKEDDISIDNLERGFFFGNTRIVGGDEAPAGSVPWMVAMSTGVMIRSLMCGGSVVTERHVLTAAHCVDAVYSYGLITGGSLTSSLRVHVGSHRWNRDDDVQYSLSGNLTHPHYVSNIIKNDLGVLITSSPIIFNDVVQPVSLNYDVIPGGVSVMAAGYGRVSAGGSTSRNLLRVFLTTLDGEECVRKVHEYTVSNNVINVPPIQPHIEICTFEAVGQGTCNGDSGSALVIAGTNVQVGAVSWGFPCAIGAPDMFASISGGAAFLQDALNTVL